MLLKKITSPGTIRQLAKNVGITSLSEILEEIHAEPIENTRTRPIVFEFPMVIDSPPLRLTGRGAMVFEKIRQFIKGEAKLTAGAGGQPTERDVKIATAVILLEVAGQDEDYAPEETETIFSVMETQFQLTEDETLDILETADALRKDGKIFDEIVTTINSSFTTAQREKVFSMAWKVILADGRVDKFEAKFAAQLRARLQLNEEQYERAKKAAELNKI